MLPILTSTPPPLPPPIIMTTKEKQKKPSIPWLQMSTKMAANAPNFFISSSCFYKSHWPLSHTLAPTGGQSVSISHPDLRAV